MKTKLIFAILSVFFIAESFAQNTVKDKEGNEYKTLSIGGKVWMAENLRSNQTKDGVELESYVYPKADVLVHGKLYSYEAAVNMCPAGWHLATEAEWDALISAVTDLNASTALLKGGSTQMNITLSGTKGVEGGFEGLDNSGMYWAYSTQEQSIGAVKMFVTGNPQVMKTFAAKESFLSVRCVKD